MEEDNKSGFIAFCIFIFIGLWIFLNFGAALGITLIGIVLYLVILSRQLKKDEKSRDELLEYVEKNQDVTIKYHNFNLPQEHKHLDVSLYEWHVNNGDFVKEGDDIIDLHAGIFGQKYSGSATIQCLKTGFIEVIAEPKHNLLEPINESNMLRESEVLYKIHNTTKDAFFNKYFTECIPLIKYDEFNKTHTLTWDKIGGNTDKIFGVLGLKDNPFKHRLKIGDKNKYSSMFFITLNCIENKDFIVFSFVKKHLKINKGSKIQFLFENNTLLEFEISKIVKSSEHFDGEDLYESKIQVSIDELDILKLHYLNKWKIIFNNGENVSNSIQQESLKFAIKHFANEYSAIVDKHVPNRIKLKEQIKTKEVNSKGEKCYLYLMIDTTNNYHKIGISNSPEYREKTLQSEKPTIEMVANKEFPNRKIAHSFEQALHSTYDEKRVRGEWFDLSQEEVDDIITSLK